MSADRHRRVRSVRLGAAVRELRQRRGLTRDEVAHRAQLNPETVARIERGEILDPHLWTIVALASALSVSAGALTDVFVGASRATTAEISNWGPVDVRLRDQASSGTDLAAVLRRFRIDAGMEIGDLAIHAGIGESTLRRLEAWRGQGPSLLVVARIALGLDRVGLRDLSAAAATLATLARVYSGELSPSAAIRARRDYRAGAGAESQP